MLSNVAFVLPPIRNPPGGYFPTIFWLCFNSEVARRGPSQKHHEWPIKAMKAEGGLVRTASFICDSAEETPSRLSFLVRYYVAYQRRLTLLGFKIWGFTVDFPDSGSRVPNHIRPTNHSGGGFAIFTLESGTHFLTYICPSANIGWEISIPFPSQMTLTPDVEVAASPSYDVAVLQADPLARPSVRSSLESRKTYQPDVINLENLGVEETPTQVEPPVVTRAYSLNIRKLNIKFAVVCLALFLEGWNLGATGPLIPAIQKHYNVRISLT